MQGSEFAKYFENLPNFQSYFVGVFAIDKFPKRIKYRHCFIGNTDVSTGPGEHWIAIFKSKPDTLEIFDSLGIGAKKKRLYLKYLQKVKGITYIDINKTRFQSDTSSSCGKFVIYYLIRRLYNPDLSYKQFLRISFKKPWDLNENLVQKYCNDLIST